MPSSRRMSANEEVDSELRFCSSDCPCGRDSSGFRCGTSVSTIAHCTRLSSTIHRVRGRDLARLRKWYCCAAANTWNSTDSAGRTRSTITVSPWGNRVSGIWRPCVTVPIRSCRAYWRRRRVRLVDGQYGYGRGERLCREVYGRSCPMCSLKRGYVTKDRRFLLFRDMLQRKEAFCYVSRLDRPKTRKWWNDDSAKWKFCELFAGLGNFEIGFTNKCFTSLYLHSFNVTFISRETYIDQEKSFNCNGAYGVAVSAVLGSNLIWCLDYGWICTSW